MERQVKRDIPHLGEVTFDRAISFEVQDNALTVAQQAEEGNEAAAFTDYILSEMMVSPSMTSTEVANLPAPAISALVEAAAETLGIQENFHSIPSEFPAQERFYQSYQDWFASTMGDLISSIGEQTRAIALNGLAPFQVDIPVLRFDYGPRMAQFAESLQAFRDAWLAQQEDALRGLRERFVQLGQAVQQRLDAAELDAQVVAPLLEQANLWIPPSAPLSLLDALKQVARIEDATPGAVEELFLEYYSSDECAPLRQMVLSWENNPHFRDRMPIIHDALEAHINDKFTLSVPALLPHVEGVASSILGMPIAYGTGEHVRGLLERGFTEFIRSASKDILVEYVTRVVYEGVDFDDFAAEVQLRGFAETDFLHRPAILHGVMGHILWPE